jgi:hypothetical protein
MKNGIIGAFVGFILGLITGTALFGPLGGAVGVILGTVFGFLIVTPLAVLFVSEAAKTPFSVNCPETHQDVQVTLDPKQAGRAELWNRRQRIAKCTRFDGPPTCDEDCVGQLNI